MRVLIDTNILLDYLIGREPYFEFADQVIAYCAAKKLNGFIAAHSIPNLFYILRKDMTEEDRRNVLFRLCKILKVEGIDQHKILCALNKKIFPTLRIVCKQNVLLRYKPIILLQEM